MHCPFTSEGKIPLSSVRKQIERILTLHYFEHLIIYTNSDKTQQVWQLSIKEENKPKQVREVQWYASLMLNRLMFCYFIHKKGFLDQNFNYLQNKLAQCSELSGNVNFYSFYRSFQPFCCLFCHTFCSSDALIAHCFSSQKLTLQLKNKSKEQCRQTKIII